MLITNGDKELFTTALRILTINIMGYTSGIDYNSSITTNLNDFSTIYITLQFLNPMTSPLLDINFPFSASFLRNYPRDIMLTNNQIQLNNVHILTPSQLLWTQSAQSSTTTTKAVLVVGVIVTNALAKSFAAVQTLMLMNLILYLKYTDVSYPEQMQALFDTSDFALPFFIFNYENPNQLILPPPPLVSKNYYTDIREGEDVFIKYGIYLYFVHNYGDRLLQFAIVFTVALIVFLFYNQIKDKRIGKIVGLIQNFLCWGWVLDFFVINYRNILICVFRLWKYCLFITDFSKMDLCVALVIFVLIHLAFIHLLKINSIIAISTQRKKKKKKLHAILSKIDKANLPSPVLNSTLISPKLKGLNSTLISPKLAPNNSVYSARLNDSSFRSAIIKPEISSFEIDSSQLKSQKINKPGGDPDSIVDIPAEKNDQSNLEEMESTMRHGKSKRRVIMPMEIDVIKKQIEAAQKQQKVLDEVYHMDKADEYNTEYETILADYKKETLKTNSYSIFFLLRFTCYSFLIVFMRNYPFFQVFLMEYINFLFILYMILDQPFGSKLKFVFALIQEIYVVYLLGFPLALVYLDMRAQLDDYTEMLIGDYFMISYFYFCILIIILIALGMLKSFYDKWKMKKQEKMMKDKQEKVGENIKLMEVKKKFLLY